MRMRDLIRGRRSSGKPPNYRPGSTDKQVESRRTIEYGSVTYLCTLVESRDGSYSVAFGYSKQEETSRVFLLSDNNVMWSRPASLPSNADVADNGTILLAEERAHENLMNEIKILDSDANILIECTIDTNIESVEITSDGRYAVILTLSNTPIVNIFDIAGGTLETKTELLLSDLSLDGFHMGGDRPLIYLTNRREPHVALDVHGEIVWRSSKYRSMQSSFTKIRDWLLG